MQTGQAQIGETEKNLAREPAARLTEMQSSQQLLKTNLHLKLDQQAARLHREQEPPIASRAQDAKLVMNESAVYTPTQPGTGESSSADSTVTVTRQTRELVNAEADVIARRPGSDPQPADNTNTVMRQTRQLVNDEADVIARRPGSDPQPADNTNTVMRQTRELVNDEARVSVSHRDRGDPSQSSQPFTMTRPSGYDLSPDSDVVLTDTSPQPGRLIREENTVTLTSPPRVEQESNISRARILSEEGLVLTTTTPADDG
jgi:hypothetical protein